MRVCTACSLAACSLGVSQERASGSRRQLRGSYGHEECVQLTQGRRYSHAWDRSCPVDRSAFGEAPKDASLLQAKPGWVSLPHAVDFRSKALKARRRSTAPAAQLFVHTSFDGSLSSASSTFGTSLSLPCTVRLPSVRLHLRRLQCCIELRSLQTHVRQAGAREEPARSGSKRMAGALLVLCATGFERSVLFLVSPVCLRTLNVLPCRKHASLRVIARRF